MASVNKVMLIGRLGADPELKYTPNGTAVAKCTLATNEFYKDSSDQKQERTEWHNIEIWGKNAENANTYLKKGSQVYFEGRLRTDKYEKDNQTKYFTKVVVERMQFLDRKGDSGSAPAESGSTTGDEETGGEDLPF